MDLDTVIHNIRRTINGKQDLLAELNKFSDPSSRLLCLVTEINIAELARISDDLKKVATKSTADSWAGQVDRQGGAFTQDEINNATEWK